MRTLRPDEAPRAGAVLAAALGSPRPQPGDAGRGRAPFDSAGVPWPTGPPVLAGMTDPGGSAEPDGMIQPGASGDRAGTGGRARTGDRTGTGDRAGTNGRARTDDRAGTGPPPSHTGARAATPTAGGGPVDGEEVLVALDDDEIVGCAVYGPVPAVPLARRDRGRVAGIAAVGVLPGARGRGVGEALVRACLERAEAAGCGAVVVRGTRDAVQAQRLCQRLGFERAPDLDVEAERGSPVLGYRYWMDCVALLADARRHRRALSGIPAHLQPRTLDDAYRIQDRLVAALAGRPVGWKVGASAAAVQRSTGVPGPIAGRLLDDHVHASGVELDPDRFIGTPGAEAEIALRLGRDLHEGPFTALSVAAAVAEVRSVVELVETRYVDPSAAGMLAVVADNCAAGELVVGEPQPFGSGVVPRELAVRLLVDGEVVAEGRGVDVLGGPLHVLAWLAGHLAARGHPLRAGELVSTGSCTGITPVRPGQRIEADVVGLGRTVVVLRAASPAAAGRR